MCAQCGDAIIIASSSDSLICVWESANFEGTGELEARCVEAVRLRRTSLYWRAALDSPKYIDIKLVRRNLWDVCGARHTSVRTYSVDVKR